jgi:predicted methyltransferase
VKQAARDADRHPAEVIAFLGMKPGDRVADFMPGQGYFTRLFSDVVGPRGHIYAIIPAEMIRAGGADEFTGTTALTSDPSYSNVTVTTQNVAEFSTPRKLDIVFTSQNYHDLYDESMEHADVSAVNRAVYRALKPGGIYLVIDHIAAKGSGHRDTETLHRIDPNSIRQEVTRAGFKLVGESAVLRNPVDDHSLSVFNPKIRGHTDQILLKFRKPMR